MKYQSCVRTRIGNHDIVAQDLKYLHADSRGCMTLKRQQRFICLDCKHHKFVQLEKYRLLRHVGDRSYSKHILYEDQKKIQHKHLTQPSLFFPKTKLHTVSKLAQSVYSIVSYMIIWKLELEREFAKLKSLLNLSGAEGNTYSISVSNTKLLLKIARGV